MYQERTGFIQQPIMLIAMLLGLSVAAHAAMSNPPAWLGVGVMLVFFTGHLQTKIDGEGVLLRMWPLWGRRIVWQDIDTMQAVTYQPLRQFGGWGIRKGKGGWAWSLRGKRGVKLTLRTGSFVIIGTDDAAHLLQQLQEMHQGKVHSLTEA